MYINTYKAYYYITLIGQKKLILILHILITTLIAAILWSLSLPFYIDILLLIALFSLFLKNSLSNTSLLFIFFAISVLSADFLLSKAMPPDKGNLFFRPDDKYWEGVNDSYNLNFYKKNVDITFPMPHGDIGGSPNFPATLRQPRLTHFRTDDLGYRNDRNFSDEGIVLVGDSFVAGSDMDQKDILVNVLRNEFGIHAYSIGFPRNPKEYFLAALHFLEKKSKNVRFYMYIFEGNDFLLTKPAPSSNSQDSLTIMPSEYDTYKLKTIVWLENNFGFCYPRLLFNLSRLAQQALLQNSFAGFPLFNAGGVQFGCLSSYIDMARAEELKLDSDEMPPEVLQRLDAVFLVPSKYRLYHPFINPPQPALIEPAPALTELHRIFDRYGVNVIDLTPILRREAAKALSEGRLLYWKDDTHWNVNGVRVAAKILTNYLNKH